MAYCVFTNCLSIIGSGITPYTSLDSRSGVGLINNGQMMFVGSSDNSGPLGIVFQHICANGICRSDITSTRYGISGNDLSLNVDSTNPYSTGGILIKYGGGVAMGTGQPCGALDVYKQGSGGASGTGDNLIVRGGNNSSTFIGNQIRFGYNGGIGYSHVIKSRHQSASNYQNALDFFLWNTTDAVETAGSKLVMTLDGSGRLGVNNCAPQFALHVNSTITGDGLIVENTLRNITCIKSTGEHSFMYIDSAHGCTYQPAIFFLRAGTLYAENRLQRASSSDPLGNYTESEGVIGTTGNTPFSIQSCGTRRLFLASNGNVGVGTISPIDKFEVVGALTTSGTAAFSKPNSGYLDFYNAQVRIGITGGNPSTPAVFRIDQYSCDYSIQRTPFYINASGNIGIGCLTPSTKLHVAGGLKSSGTTELVWFGTCDATQPLVLAFKAVGGATSADRGMQIISTEAGIGGNFLDINETSTRTRFFCSGNVNIGSCAATSYRLNVNGAFYAAGSSKEYKTSICNYNTDSCMFMKLKPVTYQYKDEWCHLGKELKSGTQIGLIAEDTAEVFPELAILKEEENEKVVRNVDYEKLTIILLSELQKLRQEVDQLKNK